MTRDRRCLLTPQRTNGASNASDATKCRQSQPDPPPRRLAMLGGTAPMSCCTDLNTRLYRPRQAPVNRRVTAGGARGGARTISAALALVASRVAVSALVGLGVAHGQSAPIQLADGLTLAQTGSGTARVAVVDAGRLHENANTAAGVLLVVLRGPCYLGLRSLVTSELQPDGIVLLAEGGRSLTRRDVEDVCGVPVVAQVHVSSNVARTIDAGLLVTRAHALPELTPLRNYVTTTVPVPAPDPATSRLQHPSHRSPQQPQTPSPHPDPSPPTTPPKIATEMPVALCATGRAAPVVSRSQAGTRHSLLKRHCRRDSAEHREAESGSDRVLRG